MPTQPARPLSEYSVADLRGIRQVYRDKLNSCYSISNPQREAARIDNLRKWIRLITGEIRWRTNNYTKV